MPAESSKDERISVLLQDTDLKKDIEQLAKKLRTSKGGVGALAISFVVPALKSGRFVVLNGEIKEASKAAA